MKIKIRNNSSIFLIFISVLIFLFTIPDNILAQDLFQEYQHKQLTPKQLKIFNSLLNKPYTRSIQLARVNMDLFETSNLINLNLSLEKSFLTVKKKFIKRGTLNFTWSGRIPGKYSDIIISVYDDALMGYMIIENECYNLRSLGERLICIVHVDPGKYPPDIYGIDSEKMEQISISSEEPTKILAENNYLKSTEVFKKSLTTNFVIRMLVAYTEGALSDVGSVSAMNALIANCIATANETFDYSEVNIELEIAHRRLVYGYQESNDIDDYTPSVMSSY